MSGSGKWRRDHERDEYVLRARREGYRSRASYKLLEMDARYHLFKPGAVVVDLGAAPGGWTQVAVHKTMPGGFVLGLDLLAMKPMPGALLLQGDFAATSAQLVSALAGRPVDLVISDMAPNLSGMKDVDQPRTIDLVEQALEFARSVLKPGGALLAKCFEGAGIARLREEIRRDFKRLSNVKPGASRAKSREIYLLARDYKGAGMAV